ncbi:hypothetical protein KKB55_04930 [Myxococcota bacterium]|nr:hypothetical protein [Myxococcota bacterium]
MPIGCSSDLGYPARAAEINREAAAVEASLLEKLEAWEAAGEQLEALRATPA